MSIYTVISIGVILFFVLAIIGLVMFINWLDRRIDKKDRLGRKSVFNGEDKNTGK